MKKRIAIFPLLLMLMNGCSINWFEVDPEPHISELINSYNLPLPNPPPQGVVYRAATQKYARGEFIAIRCDLTEDMVQNIEKQLAPGAADQAFKDTEHIIKISENIGWWPQSGAINARYYPLEPVGSNTILSKLYIVDDSTPPVAYLVLTPLSLSNEANPVKAN